MLEFTMLVVISLVLIFCLRTAPLAVPTSVPAGKDCSVYANTGTNGSPTWALQSNVQDVKLTIAPGMGELNLRNQGGVTQNVPTMQKWGASFKIAADETDGFYTALVTAFTGGTALDLQFLDGVAAPASGVVVQGPRSDWLVSKFDRDETSTAAVTYDVELAPAKTGDAQVWEVITGS